MASRRLRILAAGDNAGPWGGAQNAMLAEIEGLRRAGHQVRILTNDLTPEGRYNAADYSFPWHRVDTRAPGSYLRKIWNHKAYQAARRAVQSFRPDAVSLHLFSTQLSPAALYAFGNLPVLATVHDCAMFCPIGNRYLVKTEKICEYRFGTECLRQGCITAFKLPQALARAWLVAGAQRRVIWLAPSSYMARELVKAGYSNVEHLPYGFDLDRHRYLPLEERESTNDIIFCARLDRSKGTHVLLEAYALAKRRFPKTRLVIAGDGVELGRLRRQAEALGLAGSVVFKGWQSTDQVLAMHRTAGVMAAPFLGPDNFPLIVCESMLVGTPVAATNVGGVPDLVVEGVSGRLCRPNDAGSLADGIADILGNPIKASKMAAAARQSALGMISLDRRIMEMERLFLRELAGR